MKIRLNIIDDDNKMDDLFYENDSEIINIDDIIFIGGSNFVVGEALILF